MVMNPSIRADFASAMLFFLLCSGMAAAWAGSMPAVFVAPTLYGPPDPRVELAAAGKPAVHDASSCRRPPDYIVETADKAAAQSLEQNYRDLFHAERAGVRVLLRSRAGDEAQQRELERLANDPNYRVVKEARFELDGPREPDPLQPQNARLWDAIHVPPPWLQQQGEPVNVAVIDGLVRSDHPDLPEVVQIVPRLRDEDGKCEGGDCCPQAEGLPGFWHATRVAGLIGARRDNGLGMAGLAPVRHIVSINASLDECIGEFSLAAALHCAIDYRDADGGRVRVANISMGSKDMLATHALTNAMQRALNEDLLVVASAGNEDDNIDMMTRWPGSSNGANVLTVAARDYEGRAMAGINIGFGTIDIAAPAPMSYGKSLCTTNMPESGSEACSGDYGVFERTSAAAAVVSGAAALVWSDKRFAGCSARQMSRLLQASGSHCIRGHSYSKNKEFDICQLDLAFLSACDTSELQALCADKEGR